MREIAIEPSGSHEIGCCECCGTHSRTVWGFLRRDGDPDAAYFVHWTLGLVREHGAYFDFVLGRWGEGTTPADRYSVSLEFRQTERGPAFMIVDAVMRPVGQGKLADRALRRDQVTGTDLATRVFELADAVWLKDERIREVTGH